MEIQTRIVKTELITLDNLTFNDGDIEIIFVKGLCLSNAYSKKTIYAILRDGTKGIEIYSLDSFLSSTPNMIEYFTNVSDFLAEVSLHQKLEEVEVLEIDRTETLLCFKQARKSSWKGSA